MRELRLAGITVFSTIALVAWCATRSQAEDTDQESVYAEIAKAPEKYRNKANPLVNDPDAVAAGKVLFEEHCEDCHGTGALGGRKAPSLRAREVQQAAPGAIFWILTNGVVRKKMPVWSKLPEPERWQLVSYIKSLGTTHTSANKK
jgi:mono/diheme cytochrome c family protein